MIPALGLIADYAGGVGSSVHGDLLSDIYLVTISLAAVFFRAMTYIGNVSNFMVKDIATQADVELSDFLEHSDKYFLPILLPIFIALWVLFFSIKSSR